MEDTRHVVLDSFQEVVSRSKALLAQDLAVDLLVLDEFHESPRHTILYEGSFFNAKVPLDVAVRRKIDRSWSAILTDFVVDWL
jgi:hypothetical protein